MVPSPSYHSNRSEGVSRCLSIDAALAASPSGLLIPATIPTALPFRLLSLSSAEGSQSRAGVLLVAMTCSIRWTGCQRQHGQRSVVRAMSLTSTVSTTSARLEYLGGHWPPRGRKHGRAVVEVH